MVSGQRVAVILFGMGGPDRPEHVGAYLRTIFGDPCIINQPAVVRWILKWLISLVHGPVARKRYSLIGGKSSGLEVTEAMARELEGCLANVGVMAKCFVVMRYWRPRCESIYHGVMNWNADRIILIPMFPYFSRALSGSCLLEWRELQGHNQDKRSYLTLLSFACLPAMIDVIAESIVRCLADISSDGFRLLFSAHGLPRRMIDEGDLYLEQVERSCLDIVDRLGLSDGSWRLCFQSRMGKEEWLGPDVRDEISKAGHEGKGIILAPLGFTAENVETMVDLDIDCARLARQAGAPFFKRVPVFGSDPVFIEGLASMIVQVMNRAGDEVPFDLSFDFS